MIFTTSSSSGAFRDASTTEAPSAAIVSDTARPSPRPAPVTIATWPIRRGTAKTITKGCGRLANGAGESAGERVGELVDVAFLVERPEGDPDRLEPGLGEVLDDDPLLAPHPLDDFERRRAARRRDDDAGRVARPRQHVERELREAFEQPRAKRAHALTHRRAETTVHSERLPQTEERPGIDGPGLEARRLRLERHATFEIHRALRAPAEAGALESLGVQGPERADAERPVQPLVAQERVRIRAERAHVDRVLAQRLRAVDDHGRVRVVRDARRLGDR